MFKPGKMYRGRNNTVEYVFIHYINDRAIFRDNSPNPIIFTKNVDGTSREGNSDDDVLPDPLDQLFTLDGKRYTADIEGNLTEYREPREIWINLRTYSASGDIVCGYSTFETKEDALSLCRTQSGLNWLQPVKITI